MRRRSACPVSDSIAGPSESRNLLDHCDVSVILHQPRYSGGIESRSMRASPCHEPGRSSRAFFPLSEPRERAVEHALDVFAGLVS